MIRVNIICEGPTEEQFVNKVLYPHFILKGIQVTPRILGTGNQYGKLRHNIIQWMKQDSTAWVTTLVDLYGMNRRFPGYAENRHRPGPEKVKAVENAVKQDIEREGLDPRRFIPHFQLHEFEALLFSEPGVLEEWLSLDHDIPLNSFQKIRHEFVTPEDINDNPRTAPSKRIKAIVPSYTKVTDGVLIAEDIGLIRIRAACPHFNAWVEQLELLR